jgi:hypothetical protein
VISRGVFQSTLEEICGPLRAYFEDPEISEILIMCGTV